MVKIKEVSNFTNSDNITFTNNLSRNVERIGFDKKYFPNLTMGSFLWERAFNSENKPVQTGGQGIVYLPSEAHRSYRYVMVDIVIKECFLRKSNETDLFIVTSVSIFPGTMRVEKLSYQLLSSRLRNKTMMFESCLLIENAKFAPKISVSNIEHLSLHERLKCIT